ncbi:hypothetical protein JCM1393_00370 [Clostridium carnis]
MDTIEKIVKSLWIKTKPLRSKMKPIFNILKPIKNLFKKSTYKIKMLYKKTYEKNSAIEAILIIGSSMLICLLILIYIQGIFKVDTVSITTNKVEELYYENDYQGALAEYEKLQKEDEWPIWKVKSAKIYSYKGDIVKSNNLLKESILIRDKIIANKKDSAKYKEKDIELMNEAIFTFFMNKEYEEAISLGESYLKEVPNEKKLMKTIFTIYLANNEKNKAKDILDIYPVDKESSYDLSVFSEMNMLVDNWDEGFETLKEAWEKNENEIKIYDVINNIANYNRDVFLEKLTAVSNENPDKIVYKVWIAKVYSNLKETAYMAEDSINKLQQDDVSKIALDMIKAEIYINTDRKAEASRLLKNISNSEQDTFIGYYTGAWKAFNDGNYSEAFELCKKSILKNKDYPEVYGILMPDIMMAKGDIKSIECYFRAALEKEPFNYNIIIKIADYYANISMNNEEAIAYYKLALTINPNNSELYYNIAKLYISDEKKEDAIKELKKAISLNESKGKYHRTLGTLYLNSKMNEEGIEEIRNAYSIDSKDVLSLNNAGCYYISVEGEIERGFENIKSAYEEMPKTIDEDSKKSILNNYNKAKELYNNYISGTLKEFKKSELILLY